MTESDRGMEENLSKIPGDGTLEDVWFSVVARRTSAARAVDVLPHVVVRHEGELLWGGTFQPVSDLSGNSQTVGVVVRTMVSGTPLGGAAGVLCLKDGTRLALALGGCLEGDRAACLVEEELFRRAVGRPLAEEALYLAAVEHDAPAPDDAVEVWCVSGSGYQAVGGETLGEGSACK